MTLADILILSVFALGAAGYFLLRRRNKKKSSASGCGGHCPGCRGCGNKKI